MRAFQFETSIGIGMGKTLQNRRCNQRFIMEHEFNAYILVRKTGLFRFQRREMLPNDQDRIG